MLESKGVIAVFEYKKDWDICGTFFSENPALLIHQRLGLKVAEGRRFHNYYLEYIHMKIFSSYAACHSLCELKVVSSDFLSYHVESYTMKMK